MPVTPNLADAWFAARGWTPFAFQRQVWAAVGRGESGLLHASTGAGKTYAVWLAALRAFAQVCQDTLRRIDLFGRLGGEEFVALLPDTPLANACEAGERLRRAVADLRIDGGDGRAPVRLTVSIGAAEAKPQEEGLAQTISRADKALYCAKSSGRDRVAAA